jgi:hypothetical protein
LNTILLEKSLQDRQRTVTGQSQPIHVRFDEDRAAALPLPAHRFDTCVSTGVKVDKYQTARFDKVLYSVPRRYAFQSVTIKAYVDRIVIVSGGAVIAEHPRSYEPGRQILDPLHYLATLTRKPGCLDHAPLYRDWQLPASFTQLRNRLEVQHGPRTGSRHFIRVLQLLGQHPVDRIASVLDRLTENAPVSAEQIISRVERLGEKHHATHSDRDGPTVPSSLACVQVPLPDLSRFNQFLSCGEQTDVEFTSAPEDQSQAVATAHDVCRV